jgi:SAM-dependent methyltransferase
VAASFFLLLSPSAIIALGSTSVAFLSSSGVHRIIHEIRNQTKLPELGRKFDLITAFATAFHGGREDTWRWDEQDWNFFLSDLKQRLNPGGRIFFELNAAYHGHYYTPEILKVILRHGGRVERGHVLFSAPSNN